ncbi:MAG TPA: PilZ domain-containing protein, partial [Gemmataceae bacterium]|nr:PilZ domain-containing protein [Gemmataceae bacterium]
RIREAVDRVLARQAARAGDVERRGEARTDFVESVRVRAEDGREFTFLSRDLSPAGIRLVGTHRLLGQKVRVLVPGPPGGEPQTFLVRILWTCVLAEDLVENGGMFLDAPEGEAGHAAEG